MEEWKRYNIDDYGPAKVNPAPTQDIKGFITLLAALWGPVCGRFAHFVVLVLRNVGLVRDSIRDPRWWSSFLHGFLGTVISARVIKMAHTSVYRYWWKPFTVIQLSTSAALWIFKDKFIRNISSCPRGSGIFRYLLQNTSSHGGAFVSLCTLLRISPHYPPHLVLWPCPWELCQRGNWPPADLTKPNRSQVRGETIYSTWPSRLGVEYGVNYPSL